MAQQNQNSNPNPNQKSFLCLTTSTIFQYEDSGITISGCESDRFGQVAANTTIMAVFNMPDPELIKAASASGLGSGSGSAPTQIMLNKRRSSWVQQQKKRAQLLQKAQQPKLIIVPDPHKRIQIPEDKYSINRYSPINRITPALNQHTEITPNPDSQRLFSACDCIVWTSVRFRKKRLEEMIADREMREKFPDDSAARIISEIDGIIIQQYAQASGDLEKVEAQYERFQKVMALVGGAGSESEKLQAAGMAIRLGGRLIGIGE